MATETELETLVVRLTGEGSEFQKMLKTAEASSEATAHRIEETGSRIEAFGERVKGFGEGVVRSLEALGGIEILKKSFEAFSGREQTVIKLNAVLESHGRDVKALTADYNEFAKALSEVTLTTAGEVKQMLAKAEAYELTGDAAKAAVRNAAAIAAVNGGEAESYLRITSALAKGNIEQAMAMGRLVPELRGAKNQTDFLTKAQQLFADGMKIAKAQSESTEGALHHLQTAIKGLYGDLGEVVAKAVKPFVEGLKNAVNWARSLSPEVKQAAVVALALATAVIAIGPALTAIGVIAGTIFSPIVIVIAAVGYAVSMLIDHLGGFEKVWGRIKDTGGAAWDYIKGKTEEFLNFIQPVTDAIASFFTTAWTVIKQTASDLYDWLQTEFQAISDYISSVFDNIPINWESIRDSFRDTILFMEYTLTHFKEVANLIWSAIAYGLSVAVDSMKDLFTGLVATVIATGAAISKIFGQLWEAIKHPSKDALKGIGSGVGEEFDRVFGEVANKIGVGDSPLTKALKEDLDRAKKEVDKGFAAFKEEKLDQFGKNAIPKKEKEEAEKNALDVGTGIGKAVSSGINSELKKFDAVASGSAEALSRISAYRELLETGSDGKHHSASKTKGPDGTKLSNEPSASTGSAEAASKIDKSNQILTRIDVKLGQSNNKPSLEVAPADIGGGF